MDTSGYGPPPNNRVVFDNIKKTANRKHYWLTGPPIFNDSQLNHLQAMVDAENSPALVAGIRSDDVKPAVRRSKVLWLNVQDHRWVYEIIWAESHKANQLFEFDVVPMHDTMQLARYDAEEEGFFDWHTDVFQNDLTRKISISVPLNNQSDYEGGVLEFRESASISRPPQIAGQPVMFPSWLQHRVTPVTRGKRYSLVAWIRGPNWR